MDLSDRHALVTGASRGIGKACALELASRGAAVAVNYRSGEAEAQAVVAKITGAGGRAVAVQGDVSVPEEATAAVSATVEAFGSINVLVNNAGISRDGLIFSMEPEDWLAVMNVNFGGTFNCTRAAAEHMMRERDGAIVNVSSVMGIGAWVGQANYAASKGAVNAFTRCAALEFARFGIRVNAVMPGFSPTELVQELVEKAGRSIKKQIPMRRMAEVEEVARTVAFLAGPDASGITGSLLPIDGGVSMQLGLGKPE